MNPYYCDITKTKPKSYGMGLNCADPPPRTHNALKMENMPHLWTL